MVFSTGMSGTNIELKRILLPTDFSAASAAFDTRCPGTRCSLTSTRKQRGFGQRGVVRYWTGKISVAKCNFC
jgi:hypothetical protein